MYRFFRSLGVEHMQFIPLAEFAADGTPLASTISPAEYGAFLCELFDAWWPERQTVRVRFFDNVAEAMAGLKPGCCTMHDSCDSYAVVEYNGDVYPCDFFVESAWKLGNIGADSWPEIARRQRRQSFAGKEAGRRTPSARSASTSRSVMAGARSCGTRSGSGSRISTGSVARTSRYSPAPSRRLAMRSGSS